MYRTARTARRSPVVPALVTALVTTLALTACGGAAPAQPEPTPSSAREITIPDTEVGHQLTWFLDALPGAPIPHEELAAHFNDAFLQQVPPEQFNQLLQGITDLRVDEILQHQPRSLMALVTVGGEQGHLRMAVDDTGLIEAWLLQPAELPESPANWSELDERLAQLAPDVGFLAAEVTPGGACQPIHAVAPGDARPLGSMFKLYVLAAVVDRIEAGELQWDTKLTVTPEVKSWPSGELQNRPDGAQVSVREAAELMISISDNTATDLLIQTVGREHVEQHIAASSEHAERNLPMLTTRELFLLKTTEYPQRADEYTALDPQQRRGYLHETLSGVQLPEPEIWPSPRHIRSVEWFGSPADVCRAFTALAGLNNPEVAAVMSRSDGGLGLDEQQWPEVWFKGGSEPGVLGMGHLATGADGRTYVVVALASDPANVLAPNAPLEMLSLINGAFSLVKE